MEKFLKNYATISVLITLAFVLDWLFDLGGGISTVAIAGLAVNGEAATTVTAKEKSPDLLDNYISKKVTEERPESTPIDTIMRAIGGATRIDSFKTEFYRERYEQGRDKVTSDVAAATAGNPVVDIPVENVANISVDKTLLAVDVKGYDEDGNLTDKDLVLLVVGKIAGQGKVQVQAVNGKKDASNKSWTLCPEIPADTKLIIMGEAKSETDAQNSSYELYPDKDYNYCQIFMAQMEESFFSKMHRKEIDWGMAEYTRQNIWRMRRGMEYNFLFGNRRYVYDSVGQDHKYLTGGVTQFIEKKIAYGKGGGNLTIDAPDFVDMTQDIFTGNSGSDTRILFAGSDLMARLSKVDTVHKQLEAKKTLVKFGITWREIETNFGTLLLKHHEMLNNAGWSGKGLVLDINNIEKQEFLPMTVNDLKLKEAGIKNVDGKTITEASCLITRYADTHAIFEPKA